MSYGWRLNFLQLHSQAGNHTEGATFREKRSRDGERRARLCHIHLPLRSDAPGSCWKMKNYMALIRLHYRTSDYMHLTLVQRNKNEGREGKHT